MENTLDLTKYKKIKTVYFELKGYTGRKEDKSAEFDISEYPDYDEVIDIRTSFNTATEHRSLIVTIGKK
jgi:hypothetical protein